MSSIRPRAGALATALAALVAFAPPRPADALNATVAADATGPSAAEALAAPAERASAERASAGRTRGKRVSRTKSARRKAAARRGARSARGRSARRARSERAITSLGGATLRGSRSAVDNAYDAATGQGLTFARSRGAIVRAAEDGDYVRLGSSSNYRLRGVTAPYARPATRAFLTAFAARYRASCGEPLVVTSAMRPTSMRLRNSSDKSVHPTGMALDLRVPRTRCGNWLRRELLVLENEGVIDATEERRPAHFHVVVLRAP